jgi:hypothetical protein
VQKISPPPGFDLRTIQPVASRYTDNATRPTNPGVIWAIMLECVREIEYEYIVWIWGIQDTVKWWDFVNMVINSEVLTAVLLKIEGFVVGLARQQNVASHRL